MLLQIKATVVRSWGRFFLLQIMGEFLHIGAELSQIGTAIANQADLLQSGSPIINFGNYEKLVYNTNNLFINFHSKEFRSMNHVAFVGTFTTNLL